MIVKNCFPGGLRKAVTFSFDDGVRQDLRLMEMFRKYGIKATFNLNSGLSGKEHDWEYRGIHVSRLSPEEIRENYGGFEIAVHTVHHPDLTVLSAEGVIQEVFQDRQALEALAGYPVRGMAYPYGTCSEDLTGLLRSLGICYSRTVKSTHAYGFPEDYLAWHPTCHYMEQDAPKLADQFLAMDSDRLSLFYLWGHSYELDGNDNWKLMEEFCRKFGTAKDVWRASNMEIYLYMEALDRLVVSCDQKILFNPSAQDLWVTADGRPVKIEGGKTVRL